MFTSVNVDLWNFNKEECRISKLRQGERLNYDDDDHLNWNHLAFKTDDELQKTTTSY